MANRIQLRRGTAAQWTATNPVLAQGEPGIETDTGKQKFGNGVSGWNALPYASKGDPGEQGEPGVADDASIAAQINNTGSTTRAALNATYAPTSDNVSIAAYGDSLTEPGQWIAELKLRQPYLTVFNGGKSGQSSSEVAMRQGGLIPKVTVTGGTIPASGPVAVTVDYPTGAFKSNVAGAMANPQYVGTIAGVPGTLVADIQGARTWTFTRTTPGATVDASGQRYFISTEGPLQVRKEQILWTGRNFSYDRVITDTADMVAYLRKHVIDPAFTVVSVINGQAELLGSDAYNDLLARNALLKETYGEHYCEVRRPLIDSALAWAGITPTANDLADIANDTVPRSLQVGDGFHLNSTAQKFVGKLIAEHRTRLGYDKAGAILAANIGPDPVYVPPYTPHTITASSGLIRRYLPETLTDTALNTKITTLNNVNHVSGATDHLQPVVAGSGGTYRKASDMAFLEFNGVDERMYAAAFTVPQPFSAAIVYRLRSEGATKTILSFSNGTPASPILRRENTGNIVFSAGTAQPVTPASSLGTGWHVAYVSVNGASTIIGVDGVTATANAGANSVGGLRIGQGPTDYSDIDVAEILLWDRALNSTELASVRTDLKAAHSALP